MKIGLANWLRDPCTVDLNVKGTLLDQTRIYAVELTCREQGWDLLHSDLVNWKDCQPFQRSGLHLLAGHYWPSWDSGRALSCAPYPPDKTSEHIPNLTRRHNVGLSNHRGIVPKSCACSLDGQRVLSACSWDGQWIPTPYPPHLITPHS